MIRTHLCPVFITAAVIALTGCANSPEVRALAKSTADVATAYSNSTQEFARTSTRLAEGDKSRIEMLQISTDEAESEIELIETGWRFGGEDSKIDSLNVARSVDAETLYERLNSTATETKVAKRKGVNLNDPIKTLRSIEKPASPKSRIELLASVISDVQSELSKLQESTNEETD